MLRTHTCGELTIKDKGKKAELAGWVHRRRDHGGVIFIDLRDRYGLTQVVFKPDTSFFKEADKLRREDVIRVKGKIDVRPEGMKNPKMHTGEIELVVSELEVLNKAETPPIEVDEDAHISEEARMKYQYLYLRIPSVQKRLMIRHKAAQAIREFLDGEGFVEIETPMLIRATPEGARDYVVPSRVHPGMIYSLPQSPQLYKQILMASGFDKYYQFPRCLRDEDLRADRQPEFTQVDLEMSFVEQDDIFRVIEGAMKNVLKKTKRIDLKIPFPRMTYQEAMDKYGNDKPDIRYGYEMVDVTKISRESDFKIFKEAETIKCLILPVELSRKEIDSLEEFVKQQGGKGLAWLKHAEKGLEGPIAKFFKEDTLKDLSKETKSRKGSTLLFVAGKWSHACDVGGRLRLEIIKRKEKPKPGEFKFAWVTDFPLFEYKEDENKWNPMHHLFTKPTKKTTQFLEKDPGKVKAYLYDLALNGLEVAGGSIRIHDSSLQERVMKVIGMTHEEARTKFGFLLEAFKYGAPPHGGIAMGFDRLVALLNGLTDIREVIAFPKNKNAENPMDGCPTPWEEEQLKEVHLKLGETALKATKKK